MPDPSPKTAPLIDVIIPVYRGLEETRDCIESAIVARGRNKLASELVVIDDAGPEPEIRAYLRARGAEGVIRLLENERNLGFVETVNRGMALHPDRDVILLNSDTEVHGDWVDRLHRAATATSRVGTVTPFSNNATICSYPRFCHENPLPTGETAASLDELFARVNARAIGELPTAIGFCMYIRRECLAEIGPFDVAAFGKGYGEENDFSRRAAKRGWRNLLAGDVFVLHRGGTSFGASQTERKEVASRKLLELHPEYDDEVRKHVLADPNRPLRRTVDLIRLARTGRPKLLFVTHAIGGGVAKHVEDLALILAPRFDALVLRPSSRDATAEVELSWAAEGEELRVFFTLPTEGATLTAFLRGLGVARIHYHHWLGLDPSVWEFPAALSVPYDLTIHDFYSASPRIHLNGADLAASATTASLRSWQATHAPRVEGAARVFAPTRFVAKRVSGYFPKARVVQAAHPVPARDRASIALPILPASLADAATTIDVAVVGTLDEIKGRDTLLEAAESARARGLPLRFHVIGKIVDRAPGAVRDHGSYENDRDLAARLAKLAPHLVWYPARVAETFSYTLSVAFRLGLPVAVTDLGALGERAREYSPACLLPLELPASEIPERLIAFARASAPRREAYVAPAGDFDYTRDYGAGIVAQTPSPLPALSPRHFKSKESDRGVRPLLRRLRYAPGLAPLIRRLPPEVRVWIKRALFS